MQKREDPARSKSHPNPDVKTFLLRYLLTSTVSLLFYPSLRKMADIQSLKQALAVSPDNVPLLLMLGEAFLEQFSLEEAKTSYEAVLRVDPANPYARVHLVQLLDLDGRSSEAILRLEQVCGEYPNFGPAWMLRARLSLNENRAREAREYYERATALDMSLKNDDLLKRIRQAGGHRVVEEPRDPSPQRNGDRQAGAYYDPEFEEDDFDDDPFDDGDIEIEFDEKPDVNFDRVGGM